MTKGSKPGERRGGRKRGVPNKTNAATRERIEELADPVAFLSAIMNGEAAKAAVTKDADIAMEILPTMDQRMNAAKWLLDRLIPAAKGRALALDLPLIETGEDVLKGLQTVVAAISTGQISAEEGAVLTGVFEVERKTIETVEIEQRIRRLETGKNAA
jgi:hypothetical protein